MKKDLLLRIVFVLFFGLNLFSQTATIKGVILDDQQNPVPGVNVTYGDKGVITDFSGSYILQVPADRDVTILFSHISLKNIIITFNLRRNESYEFNPIMLSDLEQIEEIVISSKRNRAVQGIINLTPETIRKIPGANAGVENLLKSLPGVSNNNELSSQYSVRGGNYDENLVYVNEIEVYRPFLIRSGQQEGLSFVNSDLTSNVDFSAGGFQAKYGDKLSSVLDITYRRPAAFDASADLSFLGASVSAGGISKNGRLTAIGGLRYRDNSLLVGAQQTEIEFNPVFADAQTYLTYQINNKLEIGFLGNISINDYRYKPLTKQTNFGTITDAKALTIFYEGQEEDKYETYFGAFKGSYQANENLNLKLIASAYHTQEQEHFDILARYRIGDDVNTDIGSESLGEVLFDRAVGSQFTHARNDLDAIIVNIEQKGDYTVLDNLFQYGIKYTREDIRDRVQEYEIIDSAGYSIRPPGIQYINDQPYNPFDAPLDPYTNIRAFNDVQIDRLSGFLQWSKRTQLGENELWLNAGVRAHNWTVSGKSIKSVSQTVFSPRAQIAISPHWNKDMIFRLSGGMYHQPPFYRELRDSTGTVRPNVKAQQSVHVVLGNEYNFKLWKRDFILHSEVYYKKLTDVNPYTLENVRIRYRATNNAEAYAYGLDLRLTGEFVPGTESWVSFGYLKTEENIDNRGYIARPTDQRLKFGILFQDYVPQIPSLRVYLNLVYNTGLPGGSPSYADPYLFQRRLRDYRRADVGFSYILVDATKLRESGWLSPFKEFTFGFEIFNLFDNQNAITNTFVRDASTRTQYAVPNYLTPRVFNLRTTMRF